MAIYIFAGCFILLDLLTGIIKAFKNKEFCSSVMREGLFHKAGLIVVIALASLIDYAQAYIDLGIAISLTVPACVYVSLMEIGSIIENLYLINPSIIPKKVQEFFKKINEHKLNNIIDEIKNGKDDENDEDVQGPKE